MIASYWTNFARTGDPNGEGLPLWRTYSLDEHYTQLIGVEARTLAGARRSRIDLFEAAFPLR